MNSVKILYEDSRNGVTKGFALHELIRAAVAVSLAVELREVDLGEAHPCRGNTNVLREVRKNLGRLAARGRMVIAVLDRDELHRALKLPHGSCTPSMRSKVLAECSSGSDRFGVVIVPDNVESLLRDIKAARASLMPEDDWHAALDEKDQNLRDAVFLRAKGVPDLVAKLATLKSWSYLLKRVTRAVVDGK